MQVGITGATVAPQLYLAIGTSGRFNHAVGFRNAGTVVAVDRLKRAQDQLSDSAVSSPMSHAYPSAKPLITL